MNIVHVLTSLNIGGAERFVIDLSSRQIKDGHKVKIISFGNKNEPLVEVCEQLNIDIAFIQGEMKSRSKQLCVEFSLGDVIHFHSPHALRASLFALPYTAKKNVIYTRHGAHPFDSIQWKVLHQIFKRFVNSTTFVSHEASITFGKTHRWKRLGRKAVIDNGIIMPKVVPSATTNKKIKLGSVGRMVGLKNQISLLKSVASMPENIKNNMEVHFYGNGECMESLQEYAKENLPAETVTFHGIIKDRETIYSNIDILVVTSETEGLSLAIIEAMSYYTPTIASNVGGNPRLVINNKTGHLFEYNDIPALSNLIKNYAGSKELITKEGILAREHVEKSFSLDSAWEKYQELYNKTI